MEIPESKSNADKKPLLRSQLSGLLDLRDRVYSELGQAAALMITTDHDKFFKGNLDALDNYLAVARNSVVGAYETYQHLDSKIHCSRIGDLCFVVKWTFCPLGSRKMPVFALFS